MNCPGCGSRSVSVELGPDGAPLTSVARAVMDAAEGDAIEVSRDCWTCGWRETRRLQLAAIEVKAGDDTVQRRRQLVDAVHADLAAVQRIESLREALECVRNVRQGEPASGETEE